MVTAKIIEHVGHFNSIAHRHAFTIFPTFSIATSRLLKKHQKYPEENVYVKIGFLLFQRTHFLNVDCSDMDHLFLCSFMRPSLVFSHCSADKTD